MEVLVLPPQRPSKGDYEDKGRDWHLDNLVSNSTFYGTRCQSTCNRQSRPSLKRSIKITVAETANANALFASVENIGNFDHYSALRRKRVLTMKR